MKRIAVTTGTRAEYGILRPILREINNSKKLELYLIVCGMHLSEKHGMTINEIKKDGFKIYSEIKMEPKRNQMYFMSRTLGEGIIEFSKVFHKLKPDINLILGDRDEAFASAIAASHMNIPNAHISGGDKTKGGIDEYIRHAITKISNIHFATTQKSKSRIIKMGENPKFVFLSGNPSVDEILKQKITNKQKLEKKYKIKFHGDEILLLQHPVTTEVELTNQHIENTLKAIIKFKKTTIAIAPNSDTGNKEIFQKLEHYAKKYQFIKLYKNLPRSDFLGMLKYCQVLVGNSSSGIVESMYFKIPVVNIGIRQQGRERGNNVINVGNNSTILIHKAIKNALITKKRYLKNSYIYGRGNSSKKIVRILEKIKIDKNLIQKQIFY